VILLSCVRATQTTTDPTTTTGIGFVANRQRLNVSLTRAKYAMYILGHMNSLNVK
jgi:superfamily I DNA and/or RNA helicase